MTLQELENLCEYIYENIEELRNIKYNYVEGEYKDINSRKLWQQTTRTRDTIRKIVDDLGPKHF